MSIIFIARFLYHCRYFVKQYFQSNPLRIQKSLRGPVGTRRTETDLKNKINIQRDFSLLIESNNAFRTQSINPSWLSLYEIHRIIYEIFYFARITKYLSIDFDFRQCFCNLNLRVRIYWVAGIRTFDPNEFKCLFIYIYIKGFSSHYNVFGCSG